MGRIRLTVHFTGQVQGVGFRWQTARSVEALPVAGYVQNLPDGRVRLVVEAEQAVAQDALSRVRTACHHYISGENTESTPATGEFARFEVRR